VRIYLASRYTRIDEMNSYADELRGAGHEITSRWLLGSHQWDGAAAIVTATLQGELSNEIPVEASGKQISRSQRSMSAMSSSAVADHDDVLACAQRIAELDVHPAAASRRLAGLNVFHLLPTVIYAETWEGVRTAVLADAVHKVLAADLSRPWA